MTKPILKWAGRKTQILPYIDNFIKELKSNGINSFNYHEPFLGSGAVFFHLNSSNLIKNAYLNDNLLELIYFYKVIQEKTFSSVYKKIYSRSFNYNLKPTYEEKQEIYYKWRNKYNSLIDPSRINNLSNSEIIEVGVLFFLLNRTGFNGVYRKNPKGFYNTPHGRVSHKEFKKFNKISSLDFKDFKDLHVALMNANLTSVDYLQSLQNVNEGDLVYLDPPYFDTVNYYGQDVFTKTNHKELKIEIDRLIDLGAYVILSNSNSIECKNLFSSSNFYDYEIPITRTIQRKKEVNKNIQYRNDKTELLFSNIKLSKSTSKKDNSFKPVTVVELFAGVGGFRLGLEKNQNTNFKVIWSNQWEPQTKIQHASMVYENQFKTSKKEHSAEDIFTIKTKDIPNHDLLVGGFPCQDYSVATTLKNSKGLLGKKGVLWWAIHRILEEKGSKKPKYLFLENVDRLLKSPASQRGRDFAVMLKSLNDLGYAVEWRVINAADYGMPQKRHRVYFLGYHKTSSVYKKIKKTTTTNWIAKEGILAKAFKIKQVENENQFTLSGSLDVISNSFNKKEKLSPFRNTGIMIDGDVTTFKSQAVFNGQKTVLKDIVLTENIDESFYLSKEELKEWKYLKGSKKIERVNSEGYVYTYSEGKMSFPDSLEKPSRTIITGEGGPSPSRFKHVIKQGSRYRRLTPIELERLNMFPDNHTQLDGITDTKRAFFMGNALVVGVVDKIGEVLAKEI